jgi:hypothetical protein
MSRQWIGFSAGLLISVSASHAATIGVNGDSFDVTNPAYVAKLQESGHTVIPLNSFSPTELATLDAVWLDGFSAYDLRGLGFTPENLANINNFVSGGGLLLVQSPGFGFEGAEEYPFASELTVTTAPSEETIRIRVEDPYLDLVTDPDLSGWTQAGTSGHFVSITGWTGLADNGTDGDWVTISKNIGSGAAVYTFQDISRMMFEPKSQEALNLLNSILPVPEPSTYALIGAGGALLAWISARRRKQS